MIEELRQHAIPVGKAGSLFVGHVSTEHLPSLKLEATSAGRELVAVWLDGAGEYKKAMRLEKLPTDVEDGKVNWDARYARAIRGFNITIE